MTRKMAFDVDGVTCGLCIGDIMERVRVVPGVLEISVGPVHDGHSHAGHQRINDPTGMAGKGPGPWRVPHRRARQPTPEFRLARRRMPRGHRNAPTTVDPAIRPSADGGRSRVPRPPGS
jgi:hypothetical protein